MLINLFTFYASSCFEICRIVESFLYNIEISKVGSIKSVVYLMFKIAFIYIIYYTMSDQVYNLIYNLTSISCSCFSEM